MQEFEKRYDGLAVEKDMQQYWADNKIYDFKKDDSKPIYSIDTPPPTVSGSLHIGHIFSYTQAEMIARYRRMTGHNVFYPFGFDDNGLPSERLVEKETGIKARNMSRSDFAKTCIEVTGKYEQEFFELWSSLGFSCDWNLQYSTVSDNTQRISQKSFLELAKKGHAYIKESPVLWCTECQTSIAQAELDSKECDSQFHHLVFEIEGTPLIIATTRPELLYSVVCIFVNPDDDRYKSLIGKMVKVPLYDFEVPMMADEKVSIEKGTGAVMCATFGDSTDAEWVEQYNLEYKKSLLPYGKLADEVPFVGGLRTVAARKEIVKLLTEKGLVIKSDNISHAVSIHERCGTEVEILPSRQWYIDVLSKKQELLDAGDRINWYPAHMKARYTSWVENLKWDWCISRQRYFGVPFPVWYCESCNKPVFAEEKDLPVNPLEFEYKGCCECGCETFVPETAVFDTWATSSVTPQINEDTAKKYGLDNSFIPMSMRTQAHEIIRTWAFYTIVKSLYHTGDIPWKDAMICGFVLAKPGEKISKSKQNSQLSPAELIKQNSADAIRYWAANARLGTDTYFDTKDMQDNSRRFITKLWNSSKFVFSHLTDYNPANKVEDMLPIDRWIIERTNEAVISTKALLEEYEVGLARKVIDDLFWKDLCDNYIEIVKERLYKPEIHGEQERRSAQQAIYYCLFNILKMYAVYVPHETEYIYLKGFKDFEGIVSIHNTEWANPTSVDSEILEFGDIVIKAVAEVRKYKSENNLSMKTEVDEAVIRYTASHTQRLKLTEKDIIACTHAKAIKYEIAE